MSYLQSLLKFVILLLPSFPVTDFFAGLAPYFREQASKLTYSLIIALQLL
jgi:hypothetical protein